MYLFPLAEGSKAPLGGQSWKKLITNERGQYRRWLAQGLNVGFPLEVNNRSVLDFDGVNHQGGRELARDFFRKHPELCTYIVETAASNIHFHFSGKSKTRKVYNEHGQEIADIKATGYVVWVGSVIKGKMYRLIRDGPLQPFPEHLFPIPKKEVKRQTPVEDGDPTRRLIRAREWMKKREGKEDGNGRGLQMIKTCRALFQMFRLSEEEVWPLILDFNKRCIPPYTEKQLRHKIEDSMKGLSCDSQE